MFYVKDRRNHHASILGTEVTNSTNLTRNSYLITGAAGFIGSNIAQALSDVGHEVIVCDRFRTGKKWKNLERVLITEVVAPEEITSWINSEGRNLHGIIHMGAISATTETDVDKIINNNFKLSSDLWHAAIKLNLPFIYASSAATYGDGANGFEDDETSDALAKLRPLNPYGWSKLLFDRKIISQKDKGQPTPPKWTGLKFFNVYGPNEHHKGDMRSVINKVFPQVYNDKPISLFKSHRPDYSDGGQLRDFVYVRDCVSIIQWLLDNQVVSGIYNVGTGQPRSFADLVNGVGMALNKQPQIQYVDMPEQIRNSYQYFTEACITKLRKAGYAKAFYSLEDGISDYIKRDLINTIK
jgi:ADP-L-glycero-D-manno-heptose 6-epimerase